MGFRWPVVSLYIDKNFCPKMREGVSYILQKEFDNQSVFISMKGLATVHLILDKPAETYRNQPYSYCTSFLSYYTCGIKYIWIFTLAYIWRYTTTCSFAGINCFILCLNDLNVLQGFFTSPRICFKNLAAI